MTIAYLIFDSFEGPQLLMYTKQWKMFDQLLRLTSLVMPKNSDTCSLSLFSFTDKYSTPRDITAHLILFNLITIIAKGV